MMDGKEKEGAGKMVPPRETAFKRLTALFHDLQQEMAELAKVLDEHGKLSQEHLPGISDRVIAIARGLRKNFLLIMDDYDRDMDLYLGDTICFTCPHCGRNTYTPAEIEVFCCYRCQEAQVMPEVMPADSLQVQAYEIALSSLTEHNRSKNQIIRELLDWIDSEFRLDTYPPDSPGKKLWDRALEAIQ